MKKDLSNIRRMDVTLAMTVCGTDGKPIITVDDREIAILYDGHKITDNEIKKLTENDEFEKDERLLVLSPSEADKLKSLINACPDA